MASAPAILDKRPAGCAGLLFERVRQRYALEPALDVAEIEGAESELIRRFAKWSHRDQGERRVGVVLPDSDVVAGDR